MCKEVLLDDYISICMYLIQLQLIKTNVEKSILVPFESKTIKWWGSPPHTYASMNFINQALQAISQMRMKLRIVLMIFIHNGISWALQMENNMNGNLA